MALLIAYGFALCTEDLTVLRETTYGWMVVIAICVNYILLNENDEASISKVKAYLHQHFVTQDLQALCDSPRIEFVNHLDKLVPFHRKYAQDILQEIGSFGSKLESSLFGGSLGVLLRHWLCSDMAMLESIYHSCDLLQLTVNTQF